MAEKANQKTIRNYPCSVEAEQAVLGAIISDNDVANRIACNIQEDDFYTSIYKKIFAQIKKLINQNKPVDLVMLASSLEREGVLQEVGGVTTLDEERQLFRAFASGRYPAELEEYAAMFRGCAAVAGIKPEEVRTPARRRIIRIALTATTGVAAAVLLWEAARND